MNIATILAGLLTMTQGAVLTIESVHGQKVAGATKEQMAQTALAGAAATAGAFFTGTGQTTNAVLTKAIADLVSGGINLFATPLNPQYAAARANSLNLPADTTLPQTVGGVAVQGIQSAS